MLIALTPCSRRSSQVQIPSLAFSYRDCCESIRYAADPRSAATGKQPQQSLSEVLVRLISRPVVSLVWTFWRRVRFHVDKSSLSYWKSLRQRYTIKILEENVARMVLVLPYNDPPFYIRFLKSQLPTNCILAFFRYYHPGVINLVGGRYMLQLVLSHFYFSSSGG